MSNHSPSLRAQIITRRTYNRPKNAAGTEYESWEETVERVQGHQRWLWERQLGRPLFGEEESELAELKKYMMRREVMTSGRTLWLGGTAIAQRREASQFNCSFLEIENVYDLVDAQWLLLQGCGVGAKPKPGVLNGFMTPISEIDIIRSTRTDKDGYEVNNERFNKKTKTWTIVVGDTAEAWAKAIGKIIAGKFPAEKLVIDLSQIRPAGERLSGYGWICSGDEQLAVAIRGITTIMNNRAGELLTRADIHDIVNWMGTILSSRRSAEIILCDYEDEDAENFALFKDKYWEANPQRAQSNNTVVFNHKPEKTEIAKMFELMVAAGGSEPGFLNAVAAKKRAPWFRGTNPCLVGDTLVPVVGEGLVRIRDLDGRDDVNIIDGNGDVVAVPFRRTGDEAEIWEVGLSDGSVYRVTANHDFVLADGTKRAARDLTNEVLKRSKIDGRFGTVASDVDVVVGTDNVPDAVLRGTRNQVMEYVFLYTERYANTVGVHSQVPVVYFESRKRGFLEDFQVLLNLIDVGSDIIDAATGDKSILKIHDAVRFQALIHGETVEPEDVEDIHVRWVRKTDHIEPVYCCTVPTTASFDLGTIHSGNCGEILLGNRSFCNLVDLDLGKFNGREQELYRAVWVAARANYRQTCVNLNDGMLQRSWHELNEYLRLSGVGMTGIVKWEYQSNPGSWEILRELAHMGANSMADELGTPRAKAVTTCKPSGSLSKIMDTTEGIHKPLGRYIFNNVVFSKHDALVQKMEVAGYRIMEHPFDTTSVLVTLPVAYEDVEFDEVERDGEVLYVNLESAVDQLERYKMVMTNYVDHNASITVSYDSSEVPAIVDWIDTNWDDYVGVSFIFRNDPSKTAADLGYLYLPQEVVTKSVYDAYLNSLRELVIDDANSFEDYSDNTCAGGACPVR